MDDYDFGEPTPTAVPVAWFNSLQRAHVDETTYLEDNGNTAA